MGSLQHWTEGMHAAYKIAQKNSRKESEKGKRNFDKKGILCTILHAGDRVLVRNLLEKGGPGKLRSYWEDKIYVVNCRISEDSPVYEVRPENGKGRIRVLHRNLLMQCDSLPIEGPIVGQRRHVMHKKGDVRHRVEVPADTNSSSNESGDLVVGHPTMKDYSQWETSALDPEASTFTPGEPYVSADLEGSEGVDPEGLEQASAANKFAEQKGQEGSLSEDSWSDAQESVIPTVSLKEN